jgi:hypothetical protein
MTIDNNSIFANRQGGAIINTSLRTFYQSLKVSTGKVKNGKDDSGKGAKE